MASKKSKQETEIEQQRKELEQESLKILNDYYPNWWTRENSRLISIPPCRDIKFEKIESDEITTDNHASSFDKQGNKGKVKGEVNENKGEVNENKGKVNDKKGESLEENESESLVLAALQTCGLKQCIVINGFHSKLFLRAIKNREKYPKFSSELKKIAEYEIDYIIFHANLGIILCEVKTAVPELFAKGKNQLEKAKTEIPKLFEKLTGESLEMIPPISLIAFVPVKSDGISVDFIQSTDPFIQFELTGRELLNDKEKFAAYWLKKISLSADTDYFQSKSFQGFIATIATYRSSVYLSITENALHVFNRIYRQTSMKKSASETCNFNQNIFEYKDDPKSSKFQYMFLNEAQLNAVNSTKNCHLIYGPPGTGKSLALAIKALRMAKKDPKNRIFIFSELSHALEIENFLKNNGVTIGNGKFTVDTTPLIVNDEIVTPSDHIFVDEMCYSNLTFWRHRASCSGTTVCVLTLRNHFSMLENFGRNIEHPAFSSYEKHFFQTILRGTKSIIDYWCPEQKKQREQLQQLARYDRKHKNKSTITEIAIGHSIQGMSPVEFKEASSDSVLERLKTELLYLLLKKEDRSNTFSVRDVAVICVGSETAKTVRQFLEMNMSLRCATTYGAAEYDKDDSLLVVDEYFNVFSLEWPIVFMISMVCTETRENFRLLTASRAVAHLIIIERGYEQIQIEIDKQARESGLSNVLEKLLQNCGNQYEDNSENFPPLYIDTTHNYSVFFDAGVAMFRHNYIPSDIYEWAKTNVNINESCTTMCDFIDNFLNNPSLFFFFFHGGVHSLRKREVLNLLNRSKIPVFKSFVNDQAQILQKLLNSSLYSLQRESFRRFARFWCDEVKRVYVTDASTTESPRKPSNSILPSNFIALIIALDILIEATCDVWFEEQLED